MDSGSATIFHVLKVCRLKYGLSNQEWLQRLNQKARVDRCVSSRTGSRASMGDVFDGWTGVKKL